MLSAAGVMISAILVFGCGSDPSAQSESAAAEQRETLSSGAVQEATGTTTVYYFHGNVRCMTCRKIEALAEKAVRTGFADALADSSLQWRVINFQDVTNADYAEKYNLFAQTLIVSRQVNGNEIAWRNLDQIWKLVHNEEKFISYVQDEVAALMTAEPE
ncbi:MAG: hypothetical protein Kow0074_13220 [Candidatus Zixiibacteriota bacterium]